MAYLLRIVSGPHWEQSRDSLAQAQVVSDRVLRDLSPTNDRISVWEIDDDRSNLPRVIAALAANREELKRLDYVLADAASLPALGFDVEPSHGDTADDEVNRCWHRDIVVGDRTGLERVARCLLESDSPRHFSREEIARAILKSESASSLPRDRWKLKGKHVAAVDRLGAEPAT